MHKLWTGALAVTFAIPLLACRPVMTESGAPSGADVMLAVLQKEPPPAGYTQVIDRTALARVTGWSERELRHFAELMKGPSLVAVPETTPACEGAQSSKCIVLRVAVYDMGRDSATVEVVTSPHRGCGSRSNTYTVRLRTQTGTLQPELVESGFGDCGRR